MDSLLANYASSDEEEQEPQQQQQQQHQNTASNKSYSKASPLFSALPHPKSSSLFSSLPKPKPPLRNPNPPLNNRQQPISNPPKRIVQFKPPINPFTNLDDEEDNNDKEKERKKPRETESLTVTSFLSSIPAPKNSSTLGGVVPSSGSGRRSILETQAPPVVSTPTPSAPLINESGNNQSLATDFVNYDTNHPNCETAASYGTYDHQNVTTGGDAALSYGSYENYGSYGNYGNDWGDGSASMVPQTAAAAVSDSVVRVPGKRRRNEIPMEIVEVKQDELMKDRPREDQVKLTGIAFGPSYQPVSSTKGKPSKLHKRKHQIGTLYYDMKQKEMELSERRAKGFLTKAETQAKYGW